MKIYTRGGDRGETGLLGGGRVRKDDLRPEAYGAVDELNSWIGLARCESLPEPVEAILAQAQNQLFRLGAQLASSKTPDATGTAITAEQVEILEHAIDAADGQLPPLAEFILPGGTRGAALLHLARCVCRRAERRVVSLVQRDPAVGTLPIAYLNRLSDLLFVLARAVNAASNVPDVAWKKDA
jgi:cob(I)alamin adenosyltransferase